MNTEKLRTFGLPAFLEPIARAGVLSKLLLTALVLAFLAPAGMAQGGELRIFVEKRKFGLKDASGKVVLRANYNKIESAPRGFYIESGKGLGFCDMAGKIIVPPEYGGIGEPLDNGFVPFKYHRGYRYGLYNTEGKMILIPIYDRFRYLDGFIIITADKKTGVADINGKILIDPGAYEKIHAPSEGMFYVEKNKKAGYADSGGKLVIPVKYDKGTVYKDGICTMILNNQEFYFDKAGKEVPKDKALAGRKAAGPGVGGGRAHWSEWGRFLKDDKYGFEDLDGNVMVPAVYDYLRGFSEELAAVKLRGKYGFIDANGKVAAPVIYDEVKDFSEGLACVTLIERAGYIDGKGGTVIPFAYTAGDSFSDGMARVRDEKYKWGFIDKTGKAVIPIVYENAGAFSEGLAPVKKDDRHGFIGKAGEEVIPFMYNLAQSFSDGLALVQKDKDGKFGYIDKNNRQIILFSYEDGDDFSNELAAVKHNGKWGYVNKANEVIIPFEYERPLRMKKLFVKSRDKSAQPAYDKVFPPAGGMFRVEKNGKTGYVNNKGRLAIPCEYMTGRDFNKNGWCMALSGSALLYMDKAGRKLPENEVDFSGLPPAPDEVAQAEALVEAGLAAPKSAKGDNYIQDVFKRVAGQSKSENPWEKAGLVYFADNYRYGLKDKTGKIVAPAEYEEVHPPSEGMMRVLKNNRTGYMNAQGRLVIPAVYESGGDFQRGFCVVTMGGRPRYFDSTGKELHTQLRIPKSEEEETKWILEELRRKDREMGLDGVGEFRDGLAFAMRGGKCGFVNRRRIAVIPMEYEAASNRGFFEGLAAVKKNGMAGYIDRFDKIIIGLKFEDAGDFSDGLAHVRVDGKWGYIDRTGKMVIPAVHEHIWPFRGGLAITWQNGKYGYIDQSGKIAIPAVYEGAGHFSEGLAYVTNNGKSGYIDKSGKMIIPAGYDEVRDFDGGMALVRKNNRWGYIDKSGKDVIPFEYEKLDVFSEGAAPAMKDGKCGAIDREGRTLVPFEYENINVCSEDFMAVLKGGKWGFAHKGDRKLDISPRYDAVAGAFRMGLAPAGINGKGWGYIDRSGVFVIPPVLKEAPLFNRDGFAKVTELNGAVTEAFKYNFYKDPVAEYKKDEKYQENEERNNK